MRMEFKPHYVKLPTTTKLTECEDKNPEEKVPKNGSMNYIDDETYNSLLGIEENKLGVVIYCRVSSTENKTNLETKRID